MSNLIISHVHKDSTDTCMMYRCYTSHVLFQSQLLMGCNVIFLLPGNLPVEMRSHVTHYVMKRC